MIKRTQLPIAPAFAMTAHKAQGQTLDKVIIDLESCKGTESPYVMVSRVTSLNGLLILRPFKFSKIKCHQSQDTRQEIKRLNRLRLRTIAKIGTSEEQKIAAATLLDSGPNPLNSEQHLQTIKLKQHLQPQKVPLHSMRTDQQTRTEQQTWMEQQTQIHQQTNTDTDPTLNSTASTIPSKRRKTTLCVDEFTQKRRRLG